MTLEDKKVALLSGDGIGPEVIRESVKVLDTLSSNSDINFSYYDAPIGAEAIDKYGNPFPDKTKEICDSCDSILFGAIGDPKYDNNPKAKIRPEDGLLEMRKYLGLYANIRPVKVYDSLMSSSPLKASILKNTDFIVFRELTGGIYFGEKGLDEKKNSAFDTCRYTREEIERISHLAFEEAKKILDSYRPFKKDMLIEYLHLFNDKFHGLYAKHLRAIAELTKISMSEVYEVASFYAHFKIIDDDALPQSEVTIKVCDSITCIMNKSEDLAEDKQFLDSGVLIKYEDQAFGDNTLTVNSPIFIKDEIKKTPKKNHCLAGH